MAPAAPHYPSVRGWGTGQSAPLSAGHTCGHVRGVRGEGRAAAGLLRENSAPGTNPRPLTQALGQRPPLEEGRGRYSRREAGRREQGPSPRASRLQPAQARLLPARRPPARLAPPPPPARALPPALPGQRAVHARRPRPRSRRTLVRSARRRAAPRVGRRVPPRPLQARRRCLRPALAPPPPHPLGLALLSRRNRGPALRRSSPPPPPNNPRRAQRAQAPPSQRAGPGVSAAVPV